MLTGRRQLSLDETGRRRLRRQSSEIRPIIAWQESFRETSGKQQAQVEVVAKKIGQPKPTPARPLRSPSIRNESCLTISRRQVAERLKAGWNKAIAKDGQGKGRQNLNIFLNKSFETRPQSPRTPELGNGFRRSQSLYNNEDEDCNSDSSTDSESENDLPIERKDPVPRAVNPQSEQTALSQQQQPGTPQQRLSASARRAVFKAAGRQRPTTCSSPEARPRLMSAPPQPARPLSAERSRSAPPRRRQQRKARRGVEGGEVVTMVSLVSPAESEEEEVLPHPVQCPPTPEAPPTPVKPPAPSPPPPPILSLRRPTKAVTFKSSMGDGPEFRTNYPTKSPTILQEEKETNEVSRKADTPPAAIINSHPRLLLQKMGKPQNTLPSKPKPLVLQRQASRQVVEEAKKKSIVTKIPEPIQEETSVEVNGKETSQVTETVVSKTEETGPEREEESPDFKSPKERECWQLFKRMSSRGISVSFETVLRGLLTPTEYRMRRAALMATC